MKRRLTSKCKQPIEDSAEEGDRKPMTEKVLRERPSRISAVRMLESSRR